MFESYHLFLQTIWCLGKKKCQIEDRHIADISERNFISEKERVLTVVLLNTHCPSPPWLLAVSLVVAQMVLFHFPNDLPNPQLQSTPQFHKTLEWAKHPISICKHPSLLAGLHLHLQYVQYVHLQYACITRPVLCSRNLMIAHACAMCMCTWYQIYVKVCVLIGEWASSKYAIRLKEECYQCDRKSSNANHLRRHWWVVAG